MLLRVANLVVARHAPLAHRGDDLEIGRQRLDRDVEAHLVVALAGAAVRDVAGAFLAREVDQQLGDQRPSQRRGQRVHVLVQRAGLQRRKDEIADERRFGVHDERLDRARAERFLTHDVEVAFVAHVDRERDDVEVVLLVDPADCDRGVQPARVRQYRLLHGRRKHNRERTVTPALRNRSASMGRLA